MATSISSGAQSQRDARRLVVRAQPEPAARLGLEVEALRRVDHQRQARRRRRIDAQLGDRPPVGLDADRPLAREQRHIVGPGARGIDEDVRLERAGGGLDQPAADPFGADHPRFGHQRLPLQAGGVEGGDVDVRAARLGEPPIPAGPEARDRGLERGAAQRLQQRARKSRRQRVQLRPPRRIGEVDRAARREERGERGSRSAGQRPDQRPAIAFRPEGRRAAGRMIAGQALRLEDQHRGAAGERGGKARAGDAGADDRDVGHGARRSRKASIRASAASRTGSASRRISWPASETFRARHRAARPPPAGSRRG